MTLGTGIFLSTLLLLTAAAIWQLTIRKKWKLVGKIAGGLCAVVVLLGGCYYVWNYVANLPPAPKVVNELAGVRLGMSGTDVTLALGKPDSISEPSIENGATRIDFNYVELATNITFYGRDKFTTKAQIICTNGLFTKLLGFDNSSTEAEIEQRLGKPDFTSIASDGLTKLISYPKWKSAFYISKGFVTNKCISGIGVISFNSELQSPEEQRAAEAKEAAEAKLLAEAQARAAADQKARENIELQNERLRSSLKSKVSDPVPDQKQQLDPCAPDLSKAERLRRLSGYGAVRQTSTEEYHSGSHTVSFNPYGGQMLSCQ